MIYEVTLADTPRRVEVREAPGGGWVVRVDDGEPRHISGKQLGAAEWVLHEGGRAQRHALHLDGEHVALQVHGHAIRGTVVDPRAAALAAGAAGNEGEVSTPMPGVVVRVLVAEGDTVQAGQVLLVVEAMKMENEYKSAIDGTVQALHVAPGQTVEANTVLASVRPA